MERAILLTEGPVITSDDLRLGELSTTNSHAEALPVVRIPPTALEGLLELTRRVRRDATCRPVDRASTI